MGHHDDSITALRNLPESQAQDHLRDVWHAWAQGLRRRQLGGLAAGLMEAMKPLTLVAAQLAYMGEPFLGKEAGYLAKLLESDGDHSDFLRYLDAEHPSGPAAPRKST